MNSSSRDGAVIDTIILHHTKGGTVSGLVKWFNNKRSKVSCHYLISEEGAVIGIVPVKERSWHAFGANQNSIGIEICNDGRFDTQEPGMIEGYVIKNDGTFLFGYHDPYPDVQVEAIISLCKDLVAKYPIKEITTHAAVDTRNKKIDPFGLDVEYIKQESMK